MSDLMILGHHRSPGDADFHSLLAQAHTQGARPRCLCCADQPEMYVACLGRGHIVKRMPCSGLSHAQNCLSHGAPRHRTNGNLGSTSEQHGLHAQVDELRCVLESLWQRAGLNDWHPRFQGRRCWAVVRARLLKVIDGCTDPAHRIFVPEHFRIREADAIATRRKARLAELGAKTLTMAPLLIGEVKNLRRTSASIELRIRHLPDISLRLLNPVARSVTNEFGHEIRLWEHDHATRLILCGCMQQLGDSRWTIGASALMLASSDWVSFDPETVRVPLRLTDAMPALPSLRLERP